MSEYACFLHPKEKSTNKEDKCPICGKPFLFPLIDHPKKILGFEIQSSINRGFYGATYIGKNPITGIPFTIKAIPKKIYSKEDGYNKDFQTDIDNHKKAMKAGMNVPELITASFGEILDFGGVSIDCYILVMNYIEGLTLKEYKTSESLTSSAIAQIAYDLFEFLGKAENYELHHNDLKDENIIIQISDARSGRLDALDPRIKTWVIDVGSFHEKDMSDERHCRDIKRIVKHIGNMVDLYWNKNPTDKDYRVISRLNSLVKNCLGEEHVREITPEDYCRQIYNIVREGEHPWRYPLRLITVGQHYNAQTMPTYYAPYLFYDPGDKWTNYLIKPGPILLTGMRGCGKTVLLKSLHFTARAQPKNGKSKEKKEEISKRLNAESHVAFFVSSSTLLADPADSKSKELHLPNQKLILAYSLDIIRCVRYCELENIGEINYQRLEEMCSVLTKLIPWFELPKDYFYLAGIERNIESAIFQARHIKRETISGELNVLDAYDKIASNVRGLVDIWNNKHVIYLLDDLSTRYLTQKNVDELTSQLCHQAEAFSFRISTETPSLRLTTGGGQVSRLDRDYEEFDLGEQVMQELKRSGSSFIEEVLKKRLIQVSGYETLSPKELLGNQSLASIASNLAEYKKRGSYWGLKALGVLSTGDIGDSIHLFEQMLEKRTPGRGIPKDIQDEIIFNFSERKLRKLAYQDSWLHDHAMAFAVASQAELSESLKRKKERGERLRVYNEIFLKVELDQTSDDGADVFNKIVKLVENGIFVYQGGTPRSKMPKGKPSFYIKLAYRKILGVTNLMPISFRDRFEISGKALLDWIEKPTARALRATVSGKYISDEEKTGTTDWGEEEEIEEPDVKETNPVDKFTQAPLAMYDTVHEAQTLEISCILPFRVETTSLRGITREDIEGRHIIGAIGFEDRSVGTWENILKTGKPKGVTLIHYEGEQYPNRKDDICDLLSRHSVQYNIVPSLKIFSLKENELDTDVLKIFVTALPFDELVLDVTSLTKPLIFLLTSEILKQRKKLHVLHTQAGDYYPTEKEVDEVLKLIDTDTQAFVKRADDLVPGEKTGDRITLFQRRDPSSGVYLLCFLSMKYTRATTLIKELSYDYLDIIYPLSQDGENSPKSKFADEIAKTFVQEAGSVRSTASNDHRNAYKIIERLYTRYSLEEGNNFEIGLTGVKMHMVSAGMLASIAGISGVYYTRAEFDPKKYTRGTAETAISSLEIKSNTINKS